MSYLSNKLHSRFNTIDALIKLNFFLIVLVTFFGARIPFHPSNYQTHFGAETSNVTNQLLYLFLFFSSIVVVIKRFDRTLSFIKAEKYLSLFVLLCLVSALWSDYPFLSIKRSFQLFVMFLVVLEALINIEPKILLKQLKIVVSLYLFFNLFGCLFISAAIDPVFRTWRGIETQKNLLAHTTLYCLLSSIGFFVFERTNISKFYNSALILLSLFIIFMSRSSTNLIAVVLIVFLGFIFYIEIIFDQIKIGKKITGLMFLFFLSFAVIFFIFASEIFALVPGFFGKDMTLSMRVPIWEYLWADVRNNFLLGYGFATYWIMGHWRIELFASHFEGFKVNEAHNGYLDILLQLGIVGFIFFLFPIIAYIHRMLKLNSNIATNVAILLLFCMMTINITETVLYKIGIMGQTTFFFLGSYMLISVFYFNLNIVNPDEENQSKV